MSSLDLDLDGQIRSLELEWRVVYDASIVARADYQRLTSEGSVNGQSVVLARQRLEKAEAMKERIMVKIERLEDSLLGGS